MNKELNCNQIVFTEKGVVQYNSGVVSLDELAPDECIIENECSIISSGTEIARLNGLAEESTIPVFPFLPGYGSIGKIIFKGSNIKDFNIGDRVFFAGNHSSVQRFKHNQSHQWGYLFPVPAELNSVEASLACMIEIAITAPNVTDISIGDKVIVFGLGLIGILTCMLYKLQGAVVTGYDQNPTRCAQAKSLGIQTISESDLVDFSFDVSVDATGNSGAIVSCIDKVKHFGQVILLGSPRTPFQGDLTDVFSKIHMQNLTVKGAHMWQYPLNNQRGVRLSVEKVFETVFDLILSKKIPAAEIISHIVSPQEVPQIYYDLQKTPDKFRCVIIDWSK